MIFKQYEDILRGKKTQTRRLVKPNEYTWISGYLEKGEKHYSTYSEVCNEDTHARRYVRGATYAVVPKRGSPSVWYRHFEFASLFQTTYDKDCPERIRHYSHEALKHDGWVQARIRIIQIHREPLHDITEVDAIAEGVASVAEYRALWESINGKTKGARWQDNPKVWVLEFELVKG